MSCISLLKHITSLQAAFFKIVPFSPALKDPANLRISKLPTATGILLQLGSNSKN